MRKFALLIAVAGLSACTVGPDYERPDLDLPESSLDAGLLDDAQKDAMAYWWTRYRDPMLNELIEFAEPYTQEEMEEVLAEKQNNDFLGGQRSHFSDELFAILDFVPEGFAIDADLEEDPDTAKDETEDYSDLDTGLEVTEKEEPNGIERVTRNTSIY